MRLQAFVLACAPRPYNSIIMDTWAIALLVTMAATAMVFFTYVGCRTFIVVGEVLPRWAKQRGFRIIHSEARTYFQGPFSQSSYTPVYYVTVEDQKGRQRKVWVRLGWWNRRFSREDRREMGRLRGACRYLGRRATGSGQLITRRIYGRV